MGMVHERPTKPVLAKTQAAPSASPVASAMVLMARKLRTAFGLEKPALASLVRSSLCSVSDFGWRARERAGAAFSTMVVTAFGFPATMESSSRRCRASGLRYSSSRAAARVVLRAKKFMAAQRAVLAAAKTAQGRSFS